MEMNRVPTDAKKKSIHSEGPETNSDDLQLDCVPNDQRYDDCQGYCDLEGRSELVNHGSGAVYDIKRRCVDPRMRSGTGPCRECDHRRIPDSGGDLRVDFCPERWYLWYLVTVLVEDDVVIQRI